MAKWISGQPYTRFRAIRLKDGKVSFKSGAYNGLLTIETLTADRTWTFPNETGELLTRASAGVTAGSIIVTTDDSVYPTAFDHLAGTTEVYINRVQANTGNTDSTIEVTGLLATDMMFVGTDSTTFLTGGTLILGPSAIHSASRSEMWHIHMANIGAEHCNPATAMIVSYFVIS